MPKVHRSNPTSQLAPRHKLWLTLRGSFLMGPNYLRFLRAVDETGTIGQAGKVVGWSYRTCLNRIRRMESILGAKVLETERGGAAGGGARLSPQARRLVEIFDQWQEEVAEVSRRAFRKAVAIPGRSLAVVLIAVGCADSGPELGQIDGLWRLTSVNTQPLPSLGNATSGRVWAAGVFGVTGQVGFLDACFEDPETSTLTSGSSDVIVAPVPGDRFAVSYFDRRSSPPDTARPEVCSLVP